MSPGPSKGRRVAFFGGSFDPPHLGHLAVAHAARAALGLDTVLFAPVGAQPLKPVGATADFENRLAMTKLAIAGEPGFAISLADAPKVSGAPNYTMETLEKLQEELGPDCALYCLMGADSFAGLRLWHRAAEIPFVASLIVASRPGELMDDLKALLPPGLTMAEAASGPPDCNVEVRCYSVLGLSGRRAGQRAPFYLLAGLDVAISASQIREMVSKQVGAGAGGLGTGQELLPDAVAEYVRAHGLYR
jgi:nicotinate-nucleotide adenylyltransferase